MRSARSVGIAVVIFALACSAEPGSREGEYLSPVVKVALGQTPEQVQARSTAALDWQLTQVASRGRCGAALLRRPYELRYEDGHLSVDLVAAVRDPGAIPGTVSVCEDVVDGVAGAVLPTLVTLDEAVAKSRKLLSELQSQGFGYQPTISARGQYSRLYLANKNIHANPPPPDTVDDFDDIAPIFLNSRFFVQEFVVFVLEKTNITVELRLINMRRRYPNEKMEEVKRAERESKNMDVTTLRNERVYYLRASIAKKES